ncbi:hypothetical protein GCM10027589_00920 [Actinocorallia lasiicapitis]
MYLSGYRRPDWTLLLFLSSAFMAWSVINMPDLAADEGVCGIAYGACALLTYIAGARYRHAKLTVAIRYCTTQLFLGIVMIMTRPVLTVQDEPWPLPSALIPIGVFAVLAAHVKLTHALTRRFPTGRLTGGSVSSNR